MDMPDIAQQRLYNEHLVGELLETPEDVVRLLGAVQAQDYPAAKWAVAQRTKKAVNGDLDDAYNAGRILRTHIMRPTWHFVLPEDIRWLLALTAPRVYAVSAYYYRKTGLDDALFAKSEELLRQELSGSRTRTRTELANLFATAGMPADGLRMAYILEHAELEAVIVSGGMRGKQHTYALFDDRVPASPAISKDDALQRLGTRYFTSHGPAQIADFAWWSGLTVADCKKAVELCGSKITHNEIDGKTFYTGAGTNPPKPETTAHLLPNYDEYLIAFKDHGPSFDERRFSKPLPEGIFYRHIAVIDGMVMGAWQAAQQKDQLTVTLRLLATPIAAQKEALSHAAQRYASFLGAANVTVTIAD